MDDRRVSTGVERLDHILAGGLPRGRLYLVQGDPGSGKTTLSLQFLLAGVARGEPALYVTLSESREELLAVAASHGWKTEGLSIFELASGIEFLSLEEQNTIFEPSEVELAEVTRKLLNAFDELKPRCVVFDSLSELRLLAQSPLRYRRQLLALKQHFAGTGATVVMTDDRTSEAGDLQLQSLAHGVISLEQLAPLYGAERRRLRVLKMRGVGFRGGYHDFRIAAGGLRIFERLVASEHHVAFTPGLVPSGNEAVDAMLGGGLDRGTSALFLGPSGAGKSSLSMQYACAAAMRGEAASIYAFDEGFYTIEARAKALGIPFAGLIASGKLRVQQIDPAEMTPGELAENIREEVETRGTKVIVIDSLNGYLAAMPEENFLTIQLHEVLSYLRQRGALIILVVAQSGLVGPMVSPVDVSYLADTVIAFRYYEAQGRVNKAITVLKRRAGPHTNDIHALIMDHEGIRVGAPLSALQGVFGGTPRSLDQ
jgi:circadian clock protein KaiC